jgi:hypothetical protein
MGDGRLAGHSDPRLLVVKEGWRAFCADRASTAKPELMKAKQYTELTEIEGNAYDLERRRHHASFGPIRTRDLDRITSELLNLAETNLLSGNGTARPGAVLDAPGTFGKTTILTELGRAYERRLREMDPTSGASPGDDFVPVVYVSLDSAITVKVVDRTLADFFALPVPGRATRDELTAALRRVAARCGTSLFLIDDLHNLDPSRRDHRDVSGHFKHLANVLPATFVFAGIGIEESGLLDDNHDRGKLYLSQTRGRLSLYPLEPYSVDDESDRLEWRSLVASFASQLAVHGANDLERRLWRYLYRRTGGSIGSLSALLRRGANLAVDRDDARLTKPILDQVRLDAAAERRYRRRRRPDD